MSVRVAKIIEKIEVSVRVAKIIRSVLLVVACVACIAGVALSQEAAKEAERAALKAATDVSKIKVTVTDKSSYTDSKYNVKYTFDIKNGTEVDWCYLKITTYVYDSNGKELGTLTSEIGSSSDISRFKVEAGKSQSKDVIFSSSYPDDFFSDLYNSSLADYKYESIVTNGKYLE